MEKSVAKVYLLDAPYHIDIQYDYYVPDELRGMLCVGGFAVVPFGGGNKKQLAIIYDFSDASDYSKLKPIISPVCNGIVLDGEMLGLCLFMKEHFLCTVGDAVKSIIPSPALTKIKNLYSALPVSEGIKLSPKQDKLYRYVKAKQQVFEKNIVEDFGPSSLLVLSRLTAMGVLARESDFFESRSAIIETAELKEKYYAYDETELSDLVRGEKQKLVLRLLLLCGSMTLNELRDKYGISKSVIKSLCQKGILNIKTEDIFRDPYQDKILQTVPMITLSEEQEKAKNEILDLFKLKEARAALLYGVTGSGKTNVIKAVMDEVIASGRSVIMLVPEIALTPQTVGIFKAYYGERTAVIHSGLSRGERFDAWRKISEGKADICIGTRSAIFAPFKNLGLIVLDEEQEHTYKSDSNPKYHAREIARYRCAKQKAVMLLASATPSIESFLRAKENKYRLVSLTERYGNAVLPETVITDMRKDMKNGRLSPIGTELRSYLDETLKKGEQAILFINQRGYNKFISCPLCGKVLMCEHCSVSYTYHTLPNAGRGYLYCHYCGTKEPVPEKCSQCGNETLKYIGYGTQMVEEELNTLYPDAKIMRMDADTTKTKFSYDDLLSRFRRGEGDILIGTQMVTKGHDFPNVTLVGIINADSSLYLNDYKANERTFDLLTQVIGRAGRGNKKGCALIQTFNPGHPVLKLASEQNFNKMFSEEIALRKSLVFPPYCDMVLFTLSSEAENELHSACEKFTELLNSIKNEKYKDVPIVVFGPMEAPIYKLSGIYRMRLVIKCKLSFETRAFISEVYSELGRNIGKKIGISVDINPNNL